MNPRAVLSALVATTLVWAGPVPAQQIVGGLVVPNGSVVSGPVFRRDGTFVPSITTGADANAYINSMVIGLKAGQKP